MKPLHDNIFIEQLTKEQLGKIVLPDSVQDDWLRGRVISVGPKIKEDIKAGDIVIFPPAPPYSPYFGQYPIMGNDGYILINEGMILAKE